MKTKSAKSVAMKLDKKTTPYFAAYPLKALNLPLQASNSHNKPQTTRAISRLRISPMVNPYSKKKFSINRITIPAVIQPADNNWFTNYE